jgi:arylsulfatase
VTSIHGTIAPHARSFGRVAAVLFASALMAVVGCSEPPAALDGYNLVLVNIDTLRADHLGCYGYPRNTSPFLDSLCREGVVFERASSALFTGRLPSASGSTGWNAVPGPDSATLAEILGAAGYSTAFFSNTVMLRRPGFVRGFDVARHLSNKWNSSGEGRRLSDRVLEYVARRGDEPFFVYIHYLDPHAPYRPGPAAFAALDLQPRAAPVALYEEVAPELARLRADGFGPGDPRFEDLMARYDAEIRTTDEALRALVEGLEGQALLDRTLLVITADHGEEFLEHDYIEHGWTLYEEVIRVPLIFFARAGLTASRTRIGASHVDIVPTVLDLLGVDAALGATDGRRLFARDSGDLLPIDADRAQISELVLQERQIVRAVVSGRWKYIATHQRVPPAERSAHADGGVTASSVGPWGPVTHEEVYDLERDPLEQQNLLLAGDAGEAARVRARLASHLHDLRSRSAGVATTRSATAPPDIPPEDRAHLEELGYLDAGPSD